VAAQGRKRSSKRVADIGPGAVSSPWQCFLNRTPDQLKRERPALSLLGRSAVDFQSVTKLAVLGYRVIEFFSVTAGCGASLTDREKTSGRA
jgi:hypothetical protein